jgi:hypothetical protein
LRVVLLSRVALPFLSTPITWALAVSGQSIALREAQEDKPDMLTTTSNKSRVLLCTLFKNQLFICVLIFILPAQETSVESKYQKDRMDISNDKFTE